MREMILVLDFGGQYKELIARTVRSLKVYSEIHPGNMKAEKVKELNPIGIILTGGPNSVYLPDAPLCDPEIFNLGIPVLGICYGMQLMCHTLGGEVRPCDKSEYGRVNVELKADSLLFEGIPENNTVLMSHSDYVSRLPEGFRGIAATSDCPYAACENPERKLYGVQFHPEVNLTDNGQKIIGNFLYSVCKASGDYNLDDYIEKQIVKIRQEVGEQKVLLALSGGVDSAVCASLISKAIPGQLVCIFVDHGFMRLNEGDKIEEVFSKRNLKFIRVNAQDRFLNKIKGVTDPEKKRKLIGEEFVRVFEEEAKRLGDIPILAQGTIYPDVVESGANKGAVIKSHHNVGGLPENLSFKKIIEPLSGLFKDEVRAIGKKLGLPKELVMRQPFPGPGLAIRIMGEVTKEKLEILRMADHIMCEEIEKLRVRPKQYFAVYTGAYSVGVKGDDRTYDGVIALRAVTTDDFMTCRYTHLSHKVLERISTRITNEIHSVSRVVYDITSKPPATVEWE
jgi:GMP synthase (glutamine-hydrolyzing), C-terminal domain or B subunit/GMP synthase (glutamine-hydrolyzing), N-terminal domain or A subunit